MTRINDIQDAQEFTSNAERIECRAEFAVFKIRDGAQSGIIQSGWMDTIEDACDTLARYTADEAFDSQDAFTAIVDVYTWYIQAREVDAE